MSKIVFVGDTHGDIKTIGYAYQLAVAEGASRVVSVGDWGSWPGPGGDAFLAGNSTYAVSTGIPFYICRGNHDDPARLEYGQAIGWQGEHKEIAPNVFFLGRTGVWDWDGHWFGVCGGAYSIDKGYRRQGTSWWPEEKITFRDLANLEESMSEAKLDYINVLISHDSPSSLPVWPGFVKDDADSDQSRHMMDLAHEITLPEIQFSGHYHRYVNWNHEGCDVHSLSCDPIAGANWRSVLDTLAVYDTETQLVNIVNLNEFRKD